MVDRSLAVRFSVTDPERVRAALKQIGLDAEEVGGRFVKAIEPANAKLEAMKARLIEGGRGMQAFAKDVQRADGFLSAGKVTIEQHSALLELSAQKYVKNGAAAVAAAAQERQYTEAVGRVDAALRQVQQAEQRHIDDLWKVAAANKAVFQAEQQRAQAMAAQGQFNRVLGVDRETARSAQDAANAFEAAARAGQRYRDALSPTLPILRDYRAELGRINQASRLGELTDDQRAASIRRVRAEYSAQIEKVKAARVATDAHTGAVKLQGYQVANLGQQFQDLFVSLGSGQNPFIVLLQQGPQATSAVGGVSNAIALLRQHVNLGYVAAAAFAGGLAVLSARALANESAQRAVGVAFTATGRAGALSRQEIDRLVDTMAQLPNVTRSAAREFAGLFAANPNIGPARFRDLAVSVSDFATAMRVDVATAAKMLDQAMTSPSDKLAELDKTLGLRLSPSLLATARHMEAMGNKAGAQAILIEALRGRIDGLAEAAQGPIGERMDALAKGWDGFMDSLSRSPIINAAVAALTALLNVSKGLQDVIGTGKSVAALANPLVAIPGLIKSAGGSQGDPQLASLTAALDVARKRVADLKQEMARAADDPAYEGRMESVNKELEAQAQVIIDLTERIRDLTAARSTDAAAGETQATVLQPIAVEGPKFTADQINAAVNAMDAYGAQMLDLKEKEAALRAGLAQLKPTIDAGGDAAKRAQPNYDRMTRALGIATEQQRSLMTASQMAVEQARSQQRIDRAALGDRERVRAVEQARLATLGMLDTAEGKRIAQSAMVAASISTLKAAAEDELTVMRNEVVGALEIAEAWNDGAAAANKATLAAQARARVLQAGYKDEKALLDLLLQQAAAQGLGTANKAVAELDIQIAAQQRLLAVAGQSKEARDEAIRQNTLAAFRETALATATDETRTAVLASIDAFDKKTKTVQSLKTAEENLVAVQKAQAEATLAQSRAQAAGIADPAQRRAAELLIERQERINELLKEHATLADGAGKAMLDAFDSTQLSKEQERYFNDVRQKAEGMADDVSGFLVDMWVNPRKAGESMFDDVLDSAWAGVKRLIANMVAEFLKQKFILPITTQIVGGMSDLFGIVSPQSALGSSTSPAGGGLNIPGFGGTNLFGNNTISNIMNTPIFGSPITGTGAANSAGFIGVGGTLGDEFGGMAGGLPSAAATTQGLGGLTIGGAAGLAGAGLSIYGATQNPNIGTISGAAFSTAGAVVSAFPAMFGALSALGPYGMIAGAILSILGNTLFKQKPSNLGAETSFSMDQFEAGAELDFANLFRGDKHAGSLKTTDTISTALQDTMSELAEQYSDVRFGGTFGANYGRKEGTSIFYGAPDITDPSQRTTIKFDPEDEEETAKAFQDLTLAALRSADWSKLGQNVATAVVNSASTNLEGFLKDVDFAKGFATTVEFLNKGWDPATSQMAQLKTASEESGKAFSKTVTDFLDKTAELWPGVTRSFDEAGQEIVASTETTMQALRISYGQSNTEAGEAGASLSDAAGNYYTFTGAIGDATLELTSASGETMTATLDAATGVYELATSVETLSGSVASTTTVLSDQQVLAATATKNFSLGVLGLTDSFRFVNENGVDVLKEGAFEAVRPLTGLALALEENRLKTESYREGMIDAGISIDDTNRLIAASITRNADIITAQFARIDAAAAASIQASINQAINPAWQPSARDVLIGQGLDPQLYGRLLGLVSGAATGDAGALQQVGERLTYNMNDQALRDAGLALTQAQVTAILGYATSAYTRAVQPQPGGYQPANDNGSITSSGGGDGGGDGGRGAIQDTIDARRDEQRTIEQSISAQERLRDSYLDLAERTAKFRQSLLLTTGLTPLTPLQQLEEARRQYAVTLAKAEGGNQDAIQDLEGVSRTLLEKSAGYWASSSGQLTKSVRYQEDFSRVQADLLRVEGKARDYQAEAVTQLVALNATLTTVKGAIEQLNIDLDALGNNSSSPGGVTPGGGGTPGTPTTPASGFYLNNAGVLTAIKFGMESLGRGVNESISSFMPKNFKSYTGALTEDAAYAWMQQAHPSGLTGLSRLEYFAAARRAGYPTNLAFGGTDHTNWLNARTDGQRWRDFIDRLREYTAKPTDVPVGFWASFGGPTDYRRGGVFDGGNVVPFPGVWQGVVDSPTHFDVGRMGEAGPEVVMPLVRTGSGFGVRAEGGGSDPALWRGFEMIRQELAGVRRELQEDKVQRAAATRALVGAEKATADAVKRNRMPLLDPGSNKRMTG